MYESVKLKIAVLKFKNKRYIAKLGYAIVNDKGENDRTKYFLVLWDFVRLVSKQWSTLIFKNQSVAEHSIMKLLQ